MPGWRDAARQAPPRLGAVLPVGIDGAFADAPAEFAVALERAGGRHLTLFDHVLGADLTDRDPPVTAAYDYRTPFCEPMVLFGFLAAVTTTLELATGVLALPQRQTALVAKQAADVNRLSNGRLRLGVGAGLNPVEFEAMGADFSTRGARQEEQIALLRQLWTQDVVDFAGRWHRVDRAGIAPRPASTIPLWLGGRADAALRRAVRIADGFIVVVHSTSDLAIIERLADLADAAGRETFGIEALIDLPADESDYAAQLNALRRAGVSHVTVRTDGAGASWDDHLEAARRFVAE